MSLNGKLLAWIEPHANEAYVAAFIGEGATKDAHRDYPGRQPATQLCSSHHEARQWIEQQAADLDLPVKWMNDAPA